MSNTTCPYCENPYGLVGKDTCGDVSPDNFICTREKDHEGVHVACIPIRHGLCSWRDRATLYNECGRCGTPVTHDEAEYCWYCMGWLCADCWNEFGHCGHPEADRINEEARRIHETQ